MLRVLKYPLEVTNKQEIEIPEGFVILHVQSQHDIPCIWALVDPDHPKQKVFVRTFGTEQALDDILGFSYAGSYFIKDGLLVFHVWYEQ